MKNKMTLFIAVLFAWAMNASAQSSYRMVSETRTSMPYHFIHIKGDLNVKIVQDELAGVIVKGSADQISHTVTMLKNDTLFVYQTLYPGTGGKVQVVINVDNIVTLEASGKTRVDCSGLINTDFLTIRAYDGAQIKLDVRALKVDSRVTGCSTIDIAGVTASNTEETDDCGVIDSHLLDVLEPVYHGAAAM